MVDSQPAIRLLAESDSLEELTELLHRGYAPLLAAGFRYLGSHQDVATTQRRASKGECYVVLDGARIVGTIVLIPKSARFNYTAWYDRDDVCVITQLAIEPELQRRGLGSRLLDLVEARAQSQGASEIALDTAEGASHLIALYATRGYRHVGYEQWKHTNYRSVILSKALRPEDQGSSPA